MEASNWRRPYPLAFEETQKNRASRTDAGFAPNAQWKLIAEGPRRPGRAPWEDDERAIDRVPAYADGREKTDEKYHQFAERITKAHKNETALWQLIIKPWKPDGWSSYGTAGSTRPNGSSRFAPQRERPESDLPSADTETYTLVGLRQKPCSGAPIILPVWFGVVPRPSRR